MGILRAIPRIIASTILMWASSARSDGLRGLSIGDSCAAAFDVEVRSGSRPTHPFSEFKATDLITFKGTHGDRPAEIGVLCHEGVVTGQLVAFPLETESEARAVFDEQYQALVGKFGAPCTDWRKLTLWQRFELWMNGTAIPDPPGVDWNLHDDAQAKLVTARAGADSWSVIIAISGPPEIRVPAADGTERRVDASPPSCLTNP